MKFSLYLQLNEVELFIILKERQILFVGNFSFDIDQKPTKKTRTCTLMYSTSLPPISYTLIETEMLSHSLVIRSPNQLQNYL